MGPGMAGAGMMGRGQQGPPPPGYDNRYYGGPPQGREPSPGPYGARGISPSAPMQPRPSPTPSPTPIGQAIEMDARTGAPAAGPNFGLRDSDGDVQGMLALQQQRFDGAPPRPGGPEDPLSPGSVYSSE